jgi:hypothetical protein
VVQRRTPTVAWAEYCPDQTCDVVRTRHRIKNEDLQGFALAYFFLVSEYTYLDEWKRNDQLKEEVKNFLKSKSKKRCENFNDREQSLCNLRALAEAYRIEFIFIRHDEGRLHIQRLSSDEAIK